MTFPDLSQLSIPDISRATANGLSLTAATWVILQLLKKEVPALKRFMVRAVLLLALAYTATAMFVPMLFVLLAAWMVGAGAILGVDRMIKHMTKEPPDKAA